MFNRPSNPIGYALFTPESFRGRFFHLKDLRDFCKSHHINPDDAVVFRVFYPDKSDFDRKLMDISEYAFPHTELKSLGGILTEVKSFEWDAQEFAWETSDETLRYKWALSKEIKNYYNAFILFLRRASKWFSIFP